MREICTYGLMRGRAYPTRGVPLYSTLLPRLVGEMEKGGVGFDVVLVIYCAFLVTGSLFGVESLTRTGV